MSIENRNNPETLRQQFEQEVIEPTRKAMQEAMAQATSKDDAKERIKSALPKGRTFLGPTVIYSESGEGYRSAMVQTLNEQGNPEDIEVTFPE